MSDPEVTASATTTPRLATADRPSQLPRRSIQRGADGQLAELIPALDEEVAQLRQEAAVSRELTSNTIPESVPYNIPCFHSVAFRMIRFVLEGDAGDNLLTRRPNQFDNPLKRRCCYCSIM